MRSFFIDFPASTLTLVQFLILKAALFQPPWLPLVFITLHHVHRPAVTRLFSDLTELHLSALLWVELCPLERTIQVLAPGPMNVTLFGNRVFANVIKLR